MKETLTLSLVNQHKRMPKKQYIISDKVDISDIPSVEKAIDEFLCNRLWVQYTYDMGINQVDDTMVSVLTGDKNLEVYVNGPSYLVAILVKACAYNGVHLKLWFYNESTEAWDITQEMF